MPSLITPATFAAFASIRSDLVNGSHSSATKETIGVAGIFVPRAGPQLVTDGGLYYVGMGTHGDYGADETQSYDDMLGLAEALCETRDLCETPFWQFLD